MIQISQHISLKSISLNDQQELYNLMKRIYPPAYSDYWKDDGEWYVNDLYTMDNVRKELSENDAPYYFVSVENKIIGILRIVYHLDPYHQKDDEFVKLHRLYFDRSAQNRGVGKEVMTWFINQVKEEGYSKIWLDAMEKQPQALYFYEKFGFAITDKVSLDFPFINR